MVADMREIEWGYESGEVRETKIEGKDGEESIQALRLYQSQNDGNAHDKRQWNVINYASFY